MSVPTTLDKRAIRTGAFEDWERDELINNMVGALAKCKPDIRERMISYFTQADADYGRRVARRVRISTNR